MREKEKERKKTNIYYQDQRSFHFYLKRGILGGCIRPVYCRLTKAVDHRINHHSLFFLSYPLKKKKTYVPIRIPSHLSIY